MPPSVVVFGVSSANPSHRRPAIGRFSFCVCDTTCDISVFSVSTIAGIGTHGHRFGGVCTASARFTVRVCPTCSVSPVRTVFANPCLLTVISYAPGCRNCAT